MVRRYAVLLVVVAAVAMIGYVLLGQSSRSTVVRVDMTRSDSLPRIIAADSHGAVVFRDGAYRGVARDGQALWQSPSLDVVQVECGPRCDSAVLSGDLADLAADLAPDVRSDPGLPSGWEQPTTGFNAVLAVLPGGAMRQVTGADGTVSVQLTSGATISSVPAPDSGLLWAQRTNDRRAGVLVASGQDVRSGPRVLFARLTKKGWTLSDRGVSEGCIASDGTRWMGDGRLHNGSRTIDLGARGRSCDFTASGVVTVARSTGGPNGLQTIIEAFDDAGNSQWSKAVPSEAGVAVSSRADVVVVVDTSPGVEKAQVLDATGSVLSTISAVDSATFVDSGELVTVAPDGTLTWRRI